MRMFEIMSSPVSTVAPDETLARAYTQMRLEKTHHLVVVERGSVVGVLASRNNGKTGTVADVMSTDVVTAGPKTTVREAANLMRGRYLGCLPIVDGKKLVGIVTVSDLLELLGRGAISVSPRSDRAVMSGRGHHRKPAQPVR